MKNLFYCESGQALDHQVAWGGCVQNLAGPGLEKSALADPVLSWGLDVQGSLPPSAPLGSALWMGLSSNSHFTLTYTT